MSPEEKIDRALEGLLSTKDLAQLQSEVVTDSSLRSLYVERAWLHGRLQSQREVLPKLLASAQRPSALPSSVLKWGAVASVAVLGLGLFFFSFGRRPAKSNPPVATLIEARDCRWEGSELPTNQGAKLGVGTLSLAEGLATLQFESGATVTLEAPSKLSVISKMHCRLLDGSAVAEVPQSAHGFTIDTAEMEVVDLGTKFGLTSSQFGSSHVIVFQGKVEVRRPGDKAAKLLRTGGSIHYGQAPPPGDREMQRVETLTTRSDGWMQVPTSYGKGKDSFVRRLDSQTSHGSDPLIMVKHTDISPGNERRICLTFDLSGGGAVPSVEAAKLTMQIQSSGLGFSALIPDSRFAVYGVLRDRLDRWDESSMTWDNSPEITAADLSPEDFVRVAEFTISRGAAKGQIEVSTPELAEFVRSDANRMATFLIVRETGETDSQGLVHAFASKENPDARPPTLWLKSADEK